MTDFEVFLAIAIFLVIMFFVIMAAIEAVDVKNLDYDAPLMYTTGM